MKIITNERLIQRNARIGRTASFAGLIVLAGGLYLSFREPDQYRLSLAALLVGFVLSQIGIYFGNRWARSPRPDEILNKALKGLSRSYSLYHYSSPVSHLLIGPAGIWVLFPRTQRGNIVFSRGRWRQTGGGLGLFYMKIFAQEGLGRPDLEISGEVGRVQRALEKELSEDELPEIRAALVFSREDVQIEADEAPIPTLKANNLKTLIRKQAKEKRLPDEKAQTYREILHKT